MFKNKNESNIVYKCTVRLLEDSDVLECEFQPFHKGSFLIEYLCDQLEIKEKDYFGLRYVDTGKQRHWLDLAKSIIKQVKDIDPILFSFRVKFYPADPFRLTGSGRLMLYQQLKRDLRHGRLYCSMGEAAALGALIVQEELGDYDSELLVGDYVSSMHLALRQTDALEKKVMELHRKREPGQDASVAMDEFMGIARGLETYGIDPHPVKDHRGSQLYIGINHSGISTFISGKRSQHFRWNEVHKINFEGKMFIAHLSYTDASREPKKHTIGFKCPSGPACRYVWRCAIEQMLFFTLPNSQNASVVSGGGFFSWGTKFKYTGRTEREILTESINALREQKMTNSTASKRKASSVPATPSSPQGDLAQIRYSSLPRSTMSEPLGNCTMAATTDHLGNIIYGPITHDGIQIPPSLEPVSEEARLRSGSNLDTINGGVGAPDLPDYYFRDSVEHSSTESGLTNPYADPSHHRLHHHTTNKQHMLYAAGGGGKQYTLPNSVINSSTSNNNTSSNTTATTTNHEQMRHHHQQNVANANNAATSRSVRKFKLLHAFIPSFIFVVVTMAISAVLILESESEVFERIRNLPEMISLRYQYYQPLKEFFVRTLGRKS
ncbi:FERM domain-containing protein 5 [Eupeodes corollae]|uniref:FERM domain-containing protein 5 n=1 Tax=Eupeodes corollae TaxID=290404 RepID=UPI002491208B|nr:FERM domain-containing protein 5 [Eupeodes corollae]